MSRFAPFTQRSGIQHNCDKGLQMTTNDVDEMERYMERFESMRNAERAWLDEELEVEMMIEVAQEEGGASSALYLRNRLHIMRLVHEHCIRNEIELLLGVDLYDKDPHRG
ncbi:MAG: hypothetical protein NTX15_07140 [Candidatus Kapabacteria bacterium]|nr:hypothetical protein [Candidatus Kapabacteria bacterium]